MNDLKGTEGDERMNHGKGTYPNILSHPQSMVNLRELEGYKYSGMLKSANHPTLPLTIWNYTAECQYERKWDEITTMCRGLITNDSGFVVARPFPKFFNLDEYEQMFRDLPDEPFEISEKLDGSLIIAAPYLGHTVVASRGSFTSPQALWAAQMLDPRLVSWKFPFTYCLELIHPENRIVVDYGWRQELVLLAVLDTITGEEYPLSDFKTVLPKVRREEHESFQELPQRPNEEGYVVRFDSGLRVKIKNQEYVRLHRLLTGTTARTVWEALRDGWFSELIDRVPDEFHEWVAERAADIEVAMEGLRDSARYELAQIDVNQERREIAEQINRCNPPELRPLMFMLLDNKNLDPLLWRMVKPRAGEVPFKYESGDAA